MMLKAIQHIERANECVKGFGDTGCCVLWWDDSAGEDRENWLRGINRPGGDWKHCSNSNWKMRDYSFLLEFLKGFVQTAAGAVVLAMCDSLQVLINEQRGHNPYNLPGTYPVVWKQRNQQDKLPGLCCENRLPLSVSIDKAGYKKTRKLIKKVHLLTENADMSVVQQTPEYWKSLEFDFNGKSKNVYDTVRYHINYAFVQNFSETMIVLLKLYNFSYPLKQLLSNVSSILLDLAGKLQVLSVHVVPIKTGDKGNLEQRWSAVRYLSKACNYNRIPPISFEENKLNRNLYQARPVIEKMLKRAQINLIVWDHVQEFIHSFYTQIEQDGKDTYSLAVYETEIREFMKEDMISLYHDSAQAENQIEKFFFMFHIFYKVGFVNPPFDTVEQYKRMKQKGYLPTMSEKTADKILGQQNVLRKEAGTLSENEAEAIIIGTVSSSIFT